MLLPPTHLHDEGQIAITVPYPNRPTAKRRPHAGKHTQEEAAAKTANNTGRGAAWLARLTGGQEVAGSNPVVPIYKSEEYGVISQDDDAAG